ncbi:hypothetical protein [Agromyces albus]|uniref:Uncharacterized protein n=1 Tax=Agromyces albus TaxID=205332 RepID=A0A4Q2KVX0_9MICO|nr:hypothetical protein [Agromyces albus]RXZ67972.1 hypothetical protein ESP51_15510 [Agromyces albus]
MTSSQEPPLTRREARERERLREQQAPSTTPDAAPPAPRDQQVDQPVRTVPPQPQFPAPAPPPAAPAYAAPRPAGGSGQLPSPFGGAVAAPQQNPFAPRYPQPAAQPAPTSPPTPVAPPAPAPPTQFGSQFPAPSAPAPRQPSVEHSAPERTLTRRELRAMLDAQHEHELDLDDEVVATPPPAVVPSEHPLLSPPVPTRAPAPHQPAAEASLAADAVVSQKPVGHWTAQLNVPADRAEPFDQLLSRGGVSHGVPTTTNALILPSLPNQAPAGNNNPLAASGEIIVTGSINLPRSYGATGVHPSHIDSADVDRLFDQVEDGAGTGGAPIAATRAISTQGAARAMMAPPKKEGVNAPLVLAVTAGVLALGVVATLVIGAVAGLF